MSERREHEHRFIADGIRGSLAYSRQQSGQSIVFGPQPGQSDAISLQVLDSHGAAV
jgi:hypothetical protein